MSENKCFCHLNGYEVKDAKARQSVETISEDVTILEARMNTLTTAPEGSTTLDAELLDIRVGCDGTVYSSAGESVRTQITHVKSDLNELSNNHVVYIPIIETGISASKTIKNIKSLKADTDYIVSVDGYKNISSIALFEFNEDGTNEQLNIIQSNGDYAIHTGTDFDFLKIYANMGDYSDGSVSITIKSVCISKLDDNIKQVQHSLNELQHSLNELGFCYVIKDNINTSGSVVKITNLKPHTMYKLNIARFDNLTTASVNLFNIDGSYITIATLNGRDELSFITGDTPSHFNIYSNKTNFESDALGIIEVGISTGVLTDYRVMLNVETVRIFKKVTCIGDSYTAGYVVSNDGTVTGENEDYAWTHYISKKTGNEYVNCGVSGANVWTWQTSERGFEKMQSNGRSQAYIIGLMINDSSDSERHIDVGDISDIGTENRTYYAGLSKIVRLCAEQNPKGYIFIQTCPSNDERYIEYNQAVRDIVEYYKTTYNVHLVDLYKYQTLYTNKSLTKDYKSGHYTPIGYEQFAEILSYIMSDYINNNVDKFQEVYLVPYDN